MNKHHTTRGGDTALSAVIFDLTRKGYYVSIPLTESAPYDLICDTGDEVYKVQVKLRADGYAAPCTSNGVRVKAYKDSDFDYYAIVDSTFTKICYPHISLKGSTFRWDHEVSSYTAYNYWEDYRDFHRDNIPKRKASKEYIEQNRKISSYKTPEKVVWVSDEELKALVWNFPTTEVAKMLGVTDSAIYKRCKSKGIEKPPRGYWNKVEAGKIPALSG